MFGILGTWVLIVWALLSGGSLVAYYDFASVVLVIGGTFTLVFFCYPARNVGRFFSVFRTALFHKAQSNEKLIEDLVSYAEMARRDGILSLENVTKDIDDRFIVRGIQMAVDGTDPEL
ncbi:MAG: motility protein A, partial [Phycisphaeraceae bacterium]|nr:motility protein A [Phycisphaeraceae bacterium]